MNSQKCKAGRDQRAEIIYSIGNDAIRHPNSLMPLSLCLYYYIIMCLNILLKRGDLGGPRVKGGKFSETLFLDFEISRNYDY